MKNLDVGEPTQSTWHTAASSALRKCRAGSGVAGARRAAFSLRKWGKQCSDHPSERTARRQQCWAGTHSEGLGSFGFCFSSVTVACYTAQAGHKLTM